MADTKLTALTELAEAIAPDDKVYVVDISDTTDSAAGTSKFIQASNTLSYARTTAESTAGVTPTNYQYEPGNAKRYGATGDGVTDDTSALQNWLNYCSSNALPGYLPSGDYQATRLYGAYDVTNNPNGGTYGRRMKLYGDGHLHDSASIVSATPARSSITFSATTGTCIDFSSNSASWQLRNLEIEDINLIGATSGVVLDTSGAFKCRFTRLGIYNNHATGDGWECQNFDQINVEDVLVKGASGTGTGFVFKSTADADSGVDGSLSTFTKLLASDWGLGYEFGYDRASANGNFQQFNTLSSCGSSGCTVGATIGDRWENNTFNSCQFRGTTHGLKIGSRAAQNTFVSCLFQATNATTGEAAVLLGWGSTAATVICQENVFDNCSLEQADPAEACLEVYAGSQYANVTDNVFKDCSFEYTGTAGDGTKGAIYYSATSNRQANFGAIIRPTFTNIDLTTSKTDTNWYDSRTRWEPKGRNILYRSARSASGSVFSLGLIELATDEVVSVTAHVIAVDTGEGVVATGESQSASYIVSALAYNNAGNATLIGTPTAISTIEGDANFSCNWNVTGSSADLRLRCSGDTDQDVNWRATIEVMTAPSSGVL